MSPSRGMFNEILLAIADANAILDNSLYAEWRINWIFEDGYAQIINEANYIFLRLRYNFRRM